MTYASKHVAQANAILAYGDKWGKFVYIRKHGFRQFTLERLPEWSRYV